MRKTSKAPRGSAGAETFRSSALERFINAVQTATGQGLGTDIEMSLGAVRDNLALLQRAAPIAQTIVLFSNPLAGPGYDSVDRFVLAEQRRVEPDGREAAAWDALYFLGIVVGMLLAEGGAR